MLQSTVDVTQQLSLPATKLGHHRCPRSMSEIMARTPDTFDVLDASGSAECFQKATFA